MGTDIHWVMERRRIGGGSGRDVAGAWEFVMADANTAAGDRFYRFFTKFGVRMDVLDTEDDDDDESENYVPPLAKRGLPSDRCVRFSEASREDLLGDHSFTWASLDEFYRAYCRALLASGMQEDAGLMFGEGFPWSDYYGENAQYECRLIIGFDS